MSEYQVVNESKLISKNMFISESVLCMYNLIQLNLEKL